VTSLPLVTIVTPSLNQGRWIGQTIESVLDQGYPRLEYMVLDGGSRDDTLDVLRRFGDRLTWTSGPDGGQSAAINKGFRAARGEIVAWLNADDTYLPGSISAAVEHFMNHPECAMVYGEGNRIDENGRLIGRFTATEPLNLWKLAHLSDYILQQSVFMRRAAVEAVGFLDESLHWAMDWDLFLKIGKRFRIDYLPVYLGNIREHRSAKTASGGRRRLAELARVMRRHGNRRYPPGLFTYGIDTYVSGLFRAVDRWPPALAAMIRRRRWVIEGPAYRLVDRILTHAQGLYSDTWLAGRAHVLLTGSADMDTIRLVGTRPVLAGMAEQVGIDVRVEGVSLGTQVVVGPGDFDLAWQVPAAMRTDEPLGVQIRCRPTFRMSRLLGGADQRALSVQAKLITRE
jgi:glycosyltransferase involved in cell wall biosynthesis